MNNDNKFWNVCTKFLNIILLGCMWATCSLLVFTLGPSTCALNACMEKIVNNEEFEMFSFFFSSFKKYFKTASLFSLIIIILIGLMGFNFIYYIYGKEVMDIIGQVAMIFMVFVLLACLINGCILLTKYEELSLKELIINSFKMSINNPIETLMIIFITIFIPIGLFILMKELIVISFGLCSYLNWLIIPNSIKKYSIKYNEVK